MIGLSKLGLPVAEDMAQEHDACGTDIRIVYEDVQNRLNLLACDRLTTAKHRVYGSWTLNELVHDNLNATATAVIERPNRYLYPIGLNHDYRDWATDIGPFAYLPNGVLEDARAGNVLIILDQSHEGNSVSDIWQWFYDQCKLWSIDVVNVLYLTGDHLAEMDHAEFCDRNRIDDRMQVMTTIRWMHAVDKNSLRATELPTADTFKSKIKLFNCLNRMKHNHRKWFFCKMVAADLLHRGLVSMDRFSWIPPIPGAGAEDATLFDRAQALLPMVVDCNDFTRNKAFEVNPSIYHDSWFSVITETHYDDTQLFFSEKIFKPMLCFSPFLLVGSRGSLSRLRELGFRTFPMLWDESYDDMDIGPRMDAIIAQIQMVAGIDDLAGWLSRAAPALEHNYQLAASHWNDSSDRQRLLFIFNTFLS
jgi:hypothetical protein